MINSDSQAGIIEAETGFKIRGLRWIIIGLVFFATLINYIDRLTISVLAPLITKDLNLTNTEFGGIATWFLFAYTISQALSGKLYDRVGIKKGFTVSIVLWSLAAMGHAFAIGIRSLSAFRFVLGLGEAGNWPGAAKTVADWFPARQRALGMAIFNSGAAIGSVVAPPIIVGLTAYFGHWQQTFVVTGALGLIWLAVWWLIYDKPETHKWLTREELAIIREDEQTETAAVVPAMGWRELLQYRQTWAIVISRFLVDPVWWLYITWLPLFLNQVYGFDLKQIGLFAWVPYVAADAGSLFGGWLSGFLIGRGWSVNAARKAVIAFAALLMPAGIFAAFTPDPMAALALIGVVLFGFQVWINNVQTLPSDFFASNAVGSVAGLGGTGAGIGSMIFIFTTGWVVDHFSYTPILIVAGLLAPIGTIALFALAGNIKKVQFQN
ncbi:MAG TPA: MFS transporter [Pyrinomonadaceae bacterium]|jgi:ACS family hexuronate transporter-like MFS transporter|nr:MFS transporter [Pyrinomonadaceae bacterium]